MTGDFWRKDYMQTISTLGVISRQQVISAMVAKNKIFTFLEICKDLCIDLDNEAGVALIQEHFTLMEKGGILGRAPANSLMYYLTRFGPFDGHYVASARIKVGLGAPCVVRHPGELSECREERAEFQHMDGKEGVVVGHRKDTLDIRIEGRVYQAVKPEYLLFHGPFEVCKEERT
jgi:hypothetical protein